MLHKLRVLARWSAIGGLWVLIGLLVILAALLHALNGVTLDALGALKAKADELRHAE